MSERDIGQEILEGIRALTIDRATHLPSSRDSVPAVSRTCNRSAAVNRGSRRWNGARCVTPRERCDESGPGLGRAYDQGRRDLLRSYA